MNKDELVIITNAPREIAALLGDGAKVPSYRQLYGQVVNAEIPAERRNGRWYLKRSQIGEIAKNINFKKAALA